ncbi:MAG: GFA family protein [Hyphomicrobiales bacterium]|nr:MAG: GFA family protein [Hyphomicrobiales bacterium]
MPIDGSCHCGRITYEASVDPASVTICHCTDCQALTGTAFRVSVSVKRKLLRIKGEPRIYIKRGASGRRRFQHFCSDCGSPLFTSGEGEGEDAEDWGVRWGGVRQRDRLIPTRQIWRRSAPDWVCAFEHAPARIAE